MNDAIKKWVDANYQNFLKKNAPLEQGVFDHVMDWMKSPEASKYMARLERVSVPAAVDLSNKWTVEMNKKNQKALEKVKNLDGTKIVYSFSNGYTFVKLETKESYMREGMAMGHCVGSYDPSDLDMEIYSLRDSNNEPHCTIEFEVRARNLAQIKGKQNGPVIEKYHKLVVEFLNQFNFDTAYSYDLKNIGSIYFGNYIFLTSEMPKQVEIKKDLVVEAANYLHTFETLTVKGNMTISKNRRCSKIADTLIVEGDLVIEEFHGLLRLADKLVVSGHVEISDCDQLKLIGSQISAKSISVIDCEKFTQKSSSVEIDVLKAG